MKQRGLWLIAILLCLIGVSCGDRNDASSEDVAGGEAPLSCPGNGGKHFALLYSDATADWDKIIATKPAFVILGDHKDNTDNSIPAYFHNANLGIRVIAYIPMNYGQSFGDTWLSNCSQNTTLHHACDNAPMSWDCTSISIQTRVDNAMAAGYDGVFFDETPDSDSMMDYVHSCAALVKQAGADRLVIMNPGGVPPASMFNNDVDIVSVERDLAPSIDFASINDAPWRWLAVEDGISSVDTAKAHFTTFQQKHGYWYGGMPSYSALAPFYQDLATYIDQNAASACSSSSSNPTPPPSSNPSVTVHTYDLDKGGAEVTGLWTVVTDAAGAQTTGFSPLTVSVAAGNESITVSNYGPYTFDHWGNSSTAQPLVVSASGSVTVSAYYHSVTTVSVHTYDIDKGNAEVQGLWTVVTDASGKQTTGFSPLTVSVPTGATSISVQNYPPYTFDHWGNSSTAQPFTLSVSSSATVSAYYHSASTATLVVRSYDIDHGNIEVQGLWTVVTDAKGVQTTGFSPLSVTVPVGTTSVTMGDYPPYTFNHWENGTTARPRSINVAGGTTLGGYYHSK